MPNYKGLQVADAFERISENLGNKTGQGGYTSLADSVFGSKVSGADATVPTYRSIAQAQQYRDSIPTDKTASSYLQDTGVALAKGVVSVPQAAAGLVDLADAGLSALGTTMTGGNPADIQTGRFTKLLNDNGVRFADTQEILGGMYSQGTQEQQQGLSQIPGMSTEKSFMDNMDSLRQTMGYVLDNPSLAANAVVESLPSIAAGGVVGRGAAALGAQGIAAGAIGEGAVMAGQAQANMDRNAEGYTTAAQSLGAAAIGALGGAIGQVGGRIAARQGARDIDALAAGQSTNDILPKSGFKSLTTGTLSEAAEEAAQTAIENVITNVSSGKDAIQGLNQDFVLGTLAGGIMGAGTNAPTSLASSALSALGKVAEKAQAKVQAYNEKNAPERTDKPTEDFMDTSSADYNPSAAIVREAANISASSTAEELIQTKDKLDQIMATAEDHLNGLNSLQANIDKIAVLQNNVANAQAAVDQFSTTDPVRAGKAQAYLDMAVPQLEETIKARDSSTDQERKDAIKHAETLVSEARAMHSKYAPMFSSVAATVAETPTSKIFASPTKFTPDVIQAAINDSSVSEIQKTALRSLSDAVVAQNDLKNLDAVHKQVVGKELDPDYISTPQYLDQFGKALANNSVAAQDNLLSKVQSFEESHVAKAKLAETALAYATRLGSAVQIIRHNGQWVVNQGDKLTGKEARKNGALTIHPVRQGKKGSTDLVDYLTKEAAAITATRTAMQAMQQANYEAKPELQAQALQQQSLFDTSGFDGIQSGSGIVPTQSSQLPQAQQEQSFTPELDPMQSALDDYNTQGRDTNEWNPNSRAEDPRTKATPKSSTGTSDKPAKVSKPTEPVSKSSVPTEPKKQDSATESETPKPVAKASEAASRSVSEDEGAKAEPSVDTEQDFKADFDPFEDLDKELENDVQAFDEVQEFTVDDEGEKSQITTSEDSDTSVDKSHEELRAEEAAKPIQQRNLVIHGFNRKAVPLTKVANLIDYVRDGSKVRSVIRKLTNISNPEVSHVKNVEHFVKFHDAITKKVNSIVKVKRLEKGQADYQYTDYLQFLVDDEGKFDQATLTAVAAVAYTWLAENGAVTVKTQKDVAKLLRLKNVDTLPPDIYNAMAQVGDLRNVVIQQMGQRISQTLGYKHISDTSDVRKAKLDNALGSLAYKGMVELGLLEEVPLPKALIEDYRNQVTDADQSVRAESMAGLSDKSVQNFVRVKLNPTDETRPIKDVEDIIKASKRQNNVVGKIFAVKPEFTLPLLQPNTERKQSYNEAGTPIPQAAKEAMEASEKHAYGFSMPMLKVMDALRNKDEIFFKQMIGFKTENEIAEMQIMKQKGQQSINQAIDRSLEIVQQTRDLLKAEGKDGERSDFYLPQFLVSNTRGHYASDFTPQMDKIHRGLAGMKEHEVQLDVSEVPFTEDKINAMGRFYQALAMNMEEAPMYKNGDSYVTIDKADFRQFIPSMLEYLETDVPRNGINAMQKLLGGKELTHREMSHISEAVAEFGMKTQSLRALVALAEYDTARQYAAQGGSPKFRTDITFESDGVTNGPFLTGIATDSLSEGQRQAGGLFKELSSVPEYKEAGGKDLYEYLGDVMQSIWEDIKKESAKDGKKMRNAAVNALDVIYPAFGKRKGAKPITTTANYGAGDLSIIRASGREVIDALINAMDTNDPAKAAAKINAANDIIKYVNVVAKMKAKDKGETPKVIELIPTNVNPKTIELSRDQIGAINELTKKYHGEAIKLSLSAALGNFIPVRDGLTLNANLAFSFFDLIRKDALDVATEEAIKEGRLETFKGKPIEPLSVRDRNKAMKEIAKYTPVITNAMAAISKNKMQSSTPLMKFEPTWHEGDYQYKSELHFKSGNLNIDSMLVEPSNPGVSGLALAIQSMDSFVTHYVMARMPSQNYHDANAGSILEATKMAQLQNEGVFKALQSMHLNSGILKAFINTANGAFDLGSITEDTQLSDDISKAFERMTGVEAGVVDLADVLKKRVYDAYQLDITKLKKLSKENYVGQYGTQDGHYTVTEQDRTDIAQEVRRLNKEMVKQVEEAIRLGEALNKYYGYKKSYTNSTAELIREGSTARKVMSRLQVELKQYTENKNTQAYQYATLFRTVLPMAAQVIDPNMPIRTIDVFSPEHDKVPNIEQVRNEQVGAWFGKDSDGKDTIFFALSDKGADAKTVVHELMHAITVGAIEKINADPKAYPEGKVALDRMQALYAQVKAKVDADPNASDVVKYGVQNIEEFIATGFTYSDFVDYLSKIKVRSASRTKIKFNEGFREFIESVADVISGFLKSKTTKAKPWITALEALVYDTTELIQGTAQSVKQDLPVQQPIQTSTQMKLFGAPHQAASQVAGYSSLAVFESLRSSTSPEFSAHLKSLMQNVSDKIYNAMDSYLVDSNNGTWSVEDAWNEFTNSGKAVASQSAVTAGFTLSDQELFAVESLTASLTHAIQDKSMSQVYMEMNKAFKAAKAKLKPDNFYEGDWNTATPAEKADAQRMYDFLFKFGPTNPEPVARFTAMALSSEQVNKLLGFTVKDTQEQPDNVFEKLVAAADDAINYVSGLLTNSSSSQTINTRLGLLSKELARIDAKNRDTSTSMLSAAIDQVTDFTDGVSESIREKVVAIAEKKEIAKHRNRAVRLASHTTRLAANGDLWNVVDVMKDMAAMDKPNQRLGFIGELMNEAANSDDPKKAVEAMLRATKLNNQTKENIRDTTTKNVMSTFEENGEYLTKEDKHALTQLLRADVGSLLGTYTTDEIARLYTDPTHLASEINALNKRILVNGKTGQIWINRAKQLAKYMITNESSAGLAKNARLIVSGFNNELVPESNKNIELIDRLASLYAIEYTHSKVKQRLKPLFKRELKNKVNGIDTAIKFHKELATVAKRTLFTSNPASAVKGYMPEITNPNREIRVAHNSLDAKLLKDQFYKEVKPLGKDKHDAGNSPKLFMTEEANIQRLVSGAIEVVSTNRKGSSVLMEYKERDRITKAIKNNLPTDPNYNPMKDRDVYFTPSYDTSGKVTGYGYEMSANTRDTLLERNNDFAELLGAYASTNFNKVAVLDQNEVVVDALRKDYQDNFAKNPRAYVNVGPESDDIGLREVWAMLPDATRQHILDTWGEDGMFVRNDVMLMTFGYRKHSINNAFDKMEEARNLFEKLYVEMMSLFFGDNARIRGVQGERAWQEGVALMKDIIVIRNVKTMLFNTASNAFLLLSHGVNPATIVKDSVLSVKAGLQYRKDMAQLMAIRQKQRAGVGDFNSLEQQALRLEDELNRNPLRDFIEEGMMPTIVEDVDPDLNHYSYKNKMQQNIEEYTNQVPKSVRTAAKWLFVSPDTPIYKFLNNATQFSDFSAKYVMYKHYTQHAKEKLSHEEALQIASDNFINYDIPTSKGLQYLNDMGAVMFTKYAIRIQKALFQLLKKHPAAAIAQAALIGSLTNMDSALEPLIWGNIGNPFREGVFGLPFVLDEPFPIKAIF